MRLAVAAVAGVAVGFFTGNPYAGFQTFGLVYGIGGALDPNKKVAGQRLSDLKGPQASYGSPIAYIEGAPRLAGCFIWSSDKREIATTQTQGKGGPGVDSTTFTYELDCLIELADNECAGITRVFSNGKLVWSAEVDADDETLEASGETELWRDIRFYGGASDQLPDPTYEAAVGVGNAPAYRGRATVFIEGLNLGGSGQLPILTFEVVSVGTADTTDIVDVRSAITFETPPIDTVNFGVSGTEGIAGYCGPGFEYMLPAFTGGFAGRYYYTVTDNGLPDNTTITGPFTTPAHDVYSFQIAFGGTSDEPGYWILGSDDGSNLGELIDSDGFSYALQPTPLAYARWGGVTLLMSPGDATPTHPQGIGYNAITTTTAYVPTCATLYDELWHVLPDTAGTIYLYDSDLVAAGTIDDPRASGTGIITTDTVTGDLYLLDPVAATLYKYVAAEWVVWIDSVPPECAGVDNFGVSVVDGVLYAVNPVGAPTDGVETVRLARHPIVTADDVLLSDVVTRLCERTGLLTAADIDVTDLATDIVRAMAISQVGATRATLDMLGGAYLFECVEADKLRFVKRGGASVATIPYIDLGASDDGSAEPLPKRVLNDIEFAAQVTVKFANVDNDHQDGAETGDRLVTESTAVQVIELPIGFQPGEAKRLADANTMDLAVGLLQIGPISLSRAYAALEPTDVITLTDADGSTFRARIVKATLAGGVNTLELVLDDATVVNSEAATDEDYSSSHLVRILSNTLFVPLDIPLLRDVDDGPGFYAGVEVGESWGGAEIDVSPDDVTYTKVSDITDRTVLGYASTTLGDFTGGTVFDEVNTVTVDMGDGVLSSASRASVLDGVTNALLVGDEIIQFRTATLDSPGVYTLSGLLRGRRGTEWAIPGHGAAERVVLLQTTGLRRIAESSSDIGIEHYWKAVTYGKSKASAPTVEFTDTGISLKPFSPVDARASKASTGDVTLTWKRRTRLRTRFVGVAGINAPLGEDTEAYVVEVYEDDTYTTLKRTLSASSESVAYTLAQQVVDFGSMPAEISVRIMQVSATVGNGYPLDATLLLDDNSAFSPDLSVGALPLVLASTGTQWLIARPGTSYPGGRAIGFYSFEEGGDATLLSTTLSSVALPYLVDLHIEAVDTATDRFVLLLRSYTNDSGLRKMFFGTMPGTIAATVPSFMPANPPFALWWTGSEFRALLVDATVWSSADGEDWVSEGSATGAPSTTAASASTGAVVVVGSALAMKFENDVLYCADTDGLVWTAGTGDVAPIPSATYSDYLALSGIASNGTRGVIVALGKKPADTSAWGLVFTSTDGEDWALEYEEVVATNVYQHNAQLNGGVIAFDGNFVCDLWPLTGGSTINDTLPVYTFGGGATLTFANRESRGRANDNGVVGIDTTGFSPVAFFTDDLATRVTITWVET
jgi:hypothetical protein